MDALEAVMLPDSADSRQSPEVFSPADLLGIPWKRHGMTPEEGLGCWGVVRLAAQHYGYDIPHFEDAIDEATDELQEAATRFRHRFQEVDNPEAGDVVLFSVRGTGVIDHIGIMISGTRFLHSHEKGGVIMSRLNSAVYQRRVRGVLRWQK